MKNKTCAFTGHRLQKLPFSFHENNNYQQKIERILSEQIISLIEQDGVAHFITGMAIGIDMYAAEIVLDLKSQYPYITLECAIPCETQPLQWSEPLRDRYFKIISMCDKETLIQHRYSADCMQKRNQYMVNQANVILAVWNGRPSGTRNTIKYAQSQSKPIIIIHPETFAIYKI